MKALIDTFTDEEFSNIVANSKNMSELSLALGYVANSGSNYTRIRQRIDELHLSTEHFYKINKRPIKRTNENIFVQNSTADQKTLRKYYKNNGFTEYKCSICGLSPFWNGNELPLILDHINGHNKDDRIENLRWVCPNCNYQLPTTNGKNIKKLREEKI